MTRIVFWALPIMAAAGSLLVKTITCQNVERGVWK